MRYLSSYCICIAFWFVPTVAQAAEFFFTTNIDTVLVGDVVTVQAVLATDIPVNAIEGEVVVSPEQFSINKIYTGSSVISFWIHHPKERSRQTVSLSGITPGGFSGAKETVIELELLAERPGTSTITFANMRLLAHDGLGSDVAHEKQSLVFHVSDRRSEESAQGPSIDTDAPLSFTPIITADPELFEGKKVLIFTTQDKQTGVEAYYVREYRSRFGRFLSTWREVESPYILADQLQQSFIDIKAVDKVGNERVVSIVPEHAEQSTKGLVLIFAFAVMVIILLFTIRLRRRLSRLARQKVHTSQE